MGFDCVIMETFVVVTIKSWNVENFEKLKKEDPENQWILIEKKEDLALENLQKLNPRYVFFPHWSWIIPKEIFENFECIVFHMTDLPYGRGGSPLQNLIVRGHTETKISAIRVVEGLDAGDIYMKRPLSLEGKAEEIFRRLSDITFGMIREIVKEHPQPVPQEGEVVEFKRRKAEEGNIAELGDVKKIYDYIRMLNAEGYPYAFFESGEIKYEFFDAKFDEQNQIVEAKVIIHKK